MQLIMAGRPECVIDKEKVEVIEIWWLNPNVIWNSIIICIWIWPTCEMDLHSIKSYWTALIAWAPKQECDVSEFSHCRCLLSIFLCVLILYSKNGCLQLWVNRMRLWVGTYVNIWKLVDISIAEFRILCWKFQCYWFTVWPLILTAEWFTVPTCAFW